MSECILTPDDAAAATRQLSTAAERREVLVEAAVAAFAEHGFHGTPTTEIAKAAGISQAYLFRLFPTKSELYVAAVGRCYERLGDAMRAAAEDEGAEGETALERMGNAYAGLMQDRTTLRATLQAFAAAVRRQRGDPRRRPQRLRRAGRADPPSRRRSTARSCARSSARGC